MAGPAKARPPAGTIGEGVAGAIDESTERWSDVKLADGTRVKIKMSVISAARSDKHFDPATGSPIYSFDMTPQLVVVEVPPGLKKKSN